ncbi:MAG: hypothetical protein QXI68_04670 [Sulfolobales archaeon]
MDNAIRQKAKETSIDLGIVKILCFKPFTLETKRCEAVIQLGGNRMRVMKGAPQVLLQLVNNSSRESIERIVKVFGGEGLSLV